MQNLPLPVTQIRIVDHFQQGSKALIIPARIPSKLKFRVTKYKIVESFARRLWLGFKSWWSLRIVLLGMSKESRISMIASVCLRFLRQQQRITRSRGVRSSTLRCTSSAEGRLLSPPQDRRNRKHWWVSLLIIMGAVGGRWAETTVSLTPPQALAN
jgi:hypothetical protein